jgi:heptosyltransferase-2
MPLILLIVKIYIKILISKVYKLTMKILAIQNRMGIGDTVIFLPYIRAISNKFGVPVSLLVKENSKANEFLNQTNYIDEIIHLERDNKINQKHDGFKGFFKLASDLKKYNF